MRLGQVLNFFRVPIHVVGLQITIKNNNADRNTDRGNKDCKVQGQQFKQPARAHLFFLYKQPVRLFAPIAENALCTNYLCRNAVGVDRVFTLARVNKLGAHTQVHQVASFVFEISFHIQQKLGQRSLG